jgi:hypothetical protein
LTLREFRQVQLGDDKTNADIMAASMACGVSLEEAQAWFDNVPAGDAIALISKIMDKSGLSDAARFQNGSGNDAQPERAPVAP